MKNASKTALVGSLLLLLSLSACGEKAIPYGQAANEIMTYTKVDYGRTQLWVSVTGNIYVDEFNAAFEKANPDIQVILSDFTGGYVKVSPTESLIEHGYDPDVMFMTGSNFSAEFTKEHFVNLYDSPYLANFQKEAITNCSTDGNPYYLPGPSNINCLVYNKTMFDEHSWEVPTTFDEFVTLCAKINSESNGEIDAWNPNAKYANELIYALQAFGYDTLLGGTANRQWIEDISENVEGTEAYQVHMKPLYDAISTLISKGILKASHFKYSATTRRNEFKAGKIAMINVPAQTFDNDDYDFSLMAFPSLSGKLGYLNSSFGSLIGVPKKEHSDKTQDAIDRYLAYFSSLDGQAAYIGDSLQASNLKGYTAKTGSDLDAVQPVLNAGHLFTTVSFSSDSGSVNADLWQDASDMANGIKTEQECLDAIAADPFTPASTDPVTPAESIATVAADFTVLETSNYIADMYKEAAGVDIGLIANLIAYRGNLMRFFEGGLTADFVHVMVPRSLPNDGKLLKSQMTGANLIAALNKPVGLEGAGDCIYAFSGLKATVAPWNELGSRYLSVTLADGTAIDSAATYSVAFWKDSISAEFITDAPAETEGSWESLMVNKVTKEGTLTPSDDGRITLSWE